MTKKVNIVFTNKNDKSVLEEARVHITKKDDREWIIDFIKGVSETLLFSLKIDTISDIVIDEKNWTEVVYRALCLKPGGPTDQWPSVSSLHNNHVVDGITAWSVLDIKLESVLTDQVMYICTDYVVEPKDPIVISDYTLFRNVHDGSMVKTELIATKTGLELRRINRIDGHQLYILKNKYAMFDVHRVDTMENIDRLPVKALYNYPEYTENTNTIRANRIGDFEYFRTADNKVMFTFQKNPISKLAREVRGYIDSTVSFNVYLKRDLKDALNNILTTQSFYPETKSDKILHDLFELWTRIGELRDALYHINAVGYDRMKPKRM